MKTQSMLLLACLATYFVSGCNIHTQSPIEPVDKRDQQIGQYACEVTIRNFNTNEVYSAYSDTIEVVKQGQADLVVQGNKQGQLPLLRGLDTRGYGYSGIFTNLSFNQGQLTLTTGPDVMFYEYKGYKLK